MTHRKILLAVLLLLAGLLALSVPAAHGARFGLFSGARRGLQSDACDDAYDATVSACDKNEARCLKKARNSKARQDRCRAQADDCTWGAVDEYKRCTNPELLGCLIRCSMDQNRCNRAFDMGYVDTRDPMCENDFNECNNECETLYPEK
ncbi:hypothetical protein CLOP_g1457 [Closterium sp. NIES-67]|nr:hypothetical protein CLOP_g1457 [Closterium sp. NIES-67]